MIAGQSNAAGHGVLLQHYPYSGIVAGVYRVADQAWHNAIDPIASPGQGEGSVWPLVAQNWIDANATPVGFIPTAVGGTSILSWQPVTGANYVAMKAAIEAAGVPIKAILWWQGEYEASGGVVDQAYYHDKLATLAAGVWSDFDCPLVVAKLQYAAGYSDARTDVINAAIEQAYDDVAHVMPGPDLSVMRTDPDPNHLISDDKIHLAANLWWQAIAALP